MGTTLYYPFATNKSLTGSPGPTLTLARTLNTATVVNSSGFIETVNANLPRFDYDPATGESLGLLREPTRTNLCLQSNDLSATWTNVRSTDSQNAGTSPDGTSNANSVNEDGSNDTHFVDQAIALSNTTQYTYSVYLKASNRTWAMLQCYGIGLSTSTYYDLSTGAVGSDSSTDASGIEDAGNGWYRCWQTFTTGTVTTSHVIIVPASGNDGITYQGLTQESILTYGAQVEAGGFRTSHIPTTTGALARSVEGISTTDVSWLNQSAGTLYMDYYYPEAVDGTPVVIEISDNGAAERHLVYHTASGETTYLLLSGGAQATLTATGITLGARTRSVIAYELNDVEHYFDGARVGTGDQVATMPTVDRMYIGSDRLVANGITTHIREIRYDNTRLPDAILGQWSQGIFSDFISRKVTRDVTRSVTKRLVNN